MKRAILNTSFSKPMLVRLKSLRSWVLVLSVSVGIHVLGVSQTCTVSTTGTFADVAALESFLVSEVAGLNCSKIEITGSVTIDCSTQPGTLNFVGLNIDKITSISVQLIINNCQSIQSIDGFTGLKFVNDIQIRNNDAMLSFGGFPNLEKIDRNFTVYFNDVLTTIDDFPSLKQVGGVMLFSGNKELASIGNFPELDTVGSNMGFFSDKLASLGDFPKLKRVGNRLTIEGTLLASLPDFSKLETIIFNFEVFDNSLLTSLGDFSNLCQVGSFEIVNNQSLSSLGDFSNLGELSSHKFEIKSNNSLTSLGDFSKLGFIQSTLIIDENTSLIDLGNFSGLKEVGSISVWDNPSLTSINLPRLSTVGSALTINNNNNLSSISVPMLSYVGNDLWISNNDALVNVGDFSNLCHIELDLTINNNPLLNDCCVFKPILAAGGVGDEITISNNANCTEPNILACSNTFGPVSCKSDFTITLNACNDGIIDIADLVEGPSCGYIPTIDGNSFDQDQTYRLDIFDIGVHNIIVDNGINPPCSITLTVNSSCVANLTVSGMISSNIYKASQTISSDGSVTGSPVDFSAGLCINMNPNFEVIDGAIFQAYIGGCN